MPMSAAMSAMNAQPEPDAEDRKGCSGHVGKMIFSAGVEQLALVAYVPADKEAKVGAVECKQAKADLPSLYEEAVAARPATRAAMEALGRLSRAKLLKMGSLKRMRCAGVRPASARDRTHARTHARTRMCAHTHA